jgi:hypothetical protein
MARYGKALMSNAECLMSNAEARNAADFVIQALDIRRSFVIRTS